MANQYDTAYLVGYSQGYHNEAYTNDYCRLTEAQYYAKYDNGYKDGHDIKTMERLAQGRKS